MSTRRELAAAHTRALSAIYARFGKPSKGRPINKAERRVQCAMCPATFYIPLLSDTDGRFFRFRDGYGPTAPICSPECEQDMLDKHTNR